MNKRTGERKTPSHFYWEARTPRLPPAPVRMGLPSIYTPPHPDDSLTMREARQKLDDAKVPSVKQSQWSRRLTRCWLFSPARSFGPFDRIFELESVIARKLRS